MNSVLAKIKRIVRLDRIEFSEKARGEMYMDQITVSEVVESVLNAQGIQKVVRSRSRMRKAPREMLYVIHGPTNRGVWIYTKGTFRSYSGSETYYFFISSKLLE